MIVGGRAANDAAKHTMELRIAAEAGFERGVEKLSLSAVSVNLLKAFDALAIAKLDHTGSGLLAEKAT